MKRLGLFLIKGLFWRYQRSFLRSSKNFWQRSSTPTFQDHDFVFSRAFYFLGAHFIAFGRVHFSKDQGILFTFTFHFSINLTTNLTKTSIPLPLFYSIKKTLCTINKKHSLHTHSTPYLLRNLFKESTHVYIYIYISLYFVTD